jgi:hypothetical protein
MRVSLLLMVTRVALAAQGLPPALAELFNKGVQAEKVGQLDAAERAFLGCSSRAASTAIP